MEIILFIRVLPMRYNRHAIIVFISLGVLNCPAELVS